MNEIEHKIQEIKSRDRQLRIIYVLAGIVLVSFFAMVYQYVQNLKLEKEQEAEILELKLENQELLKKSEENREKSIKEYTNDEVFKLESLLRQIRDGVSDKSLLQAVDSIEKTIGTLSKIVSDTTIIRYHKMAADGNIIAQVVNDIKEHEFLLDTRKVEKDNRRNKVNTLYYGSFVKQEHVDLLLEGLKRKNFDITSVIPFEKSTEEAWKNTAIELIYENKEVPKINPVANDNEKYVIKMYCFNPNPTLKDSISNFLSKNSYHLKKYPDWIEKPSFFSSRPTVFYYDESTKDKAESIKNNLNRRFKKFGVQFESLRGGGVGITPEERKNTFVLHYIDVNKKNVFDIANSNYLIKLYSFNMNTKERNDIYLFLRKYGFQNIEALAFNKEKPQWMSTSPSVLYFSEKSFDKAQEIAKILTKLKGARYEVVKGGNHEKIEKGKEETIFLIHNMKE